MVLKPEVVEQATVYTPENGAYKYRVEFNTHYGYKLLRRYNPRTDVPNYMFWNRCTEVESWIQLEGGQWYSAYACRPALWMLALEDVELIIERDIELHPYP